MKVMKENLIKERQESKMIMIEREDEMEKLE